MATHYSPKIVTEGLVLYLSYLDSYPGSGADWTDLSPEGNDGELRRDGASHAAIGTVSSSNYSMGLGGDTGSGLGDNIYLDSDLALNTTRGFTACFLLKQANIQSNDSSWNQMASQTDNLNFGTYSSPGRHLSLKDTGQTPNVNVVSGLSNGIHEYWSYVAVGTVGTTRIPFLYKFNQGKLQKYDTDIAYTDDDIDWRFFGSGYDNWSGVTNKYPWTGDISVIQMYDKSLTFYEINQNYIFFQKRWGSVGINI
tara:strand:- start:230 stop:988 length:759 start_codon:yes stop_codon:yes gene_type:complete